ncbi:ribonuclease H protein [Trifolium medium]|uniref:Ribonuclease H protein n=1 Tax=Trifolium medium TaxID=97028 RepID=A0A392M8I6_9FABA|nr:ribonuclease H protein [Trifolium medium]
MKKVCTPYSAGGLDLRPLSNINAAMMLHLCWKFLLSNDQWAIMCRARFLKHGFLIRTAICSSIWHGIKPYYEEVIRSSVWIFGTGDKILYWRDNWLGTPLVEILNIPIAVHKLLNTKVVEMINNFSWIIPNDIAALDPQLVTKIKNIIIPRQPYEDLLVWKDSKDGLLTSKQAYQHVFPAPTAPFLPFQLWYDYISSSHSFVVWLCFHNKMPTDENLRKRGCVVVSICVLCMADCESAAHLFLFCPFTVQLCNWLGDLFGVIFATTDYASLFASFSQAWSTQVHCIALAAIIHTFHTIWMARNVIRFNNASITLHAAKMKIRTTVAEGYTAALKMSLILWKSTTIYWINANTDGSVVEHSVACGCVFRDHMANFLGGFATKIPYSIVLHAELMAIILALEMAQGMVTPLD